MPKLKYVPFRQWHLGVAFGSAFALSVALPAKAESIKIGYLPTPSSGPLFVAVERGYFTAENLTAEIVSFDAGQPVAVATVSGDLDFGTAGVTSALYTLAGEGKLKLIAASTYDKPNFAASGIVVSNQAYAAGLKSLKDMGNHSTALTQIGSSYHYVFAMVAEKNGVDLKTVRTLPLQSFSNIAAAIVGGQADTAVVTSNLVPGMLDKGQAKLLLWTAEQVPWQVSVMWTSTGVANKRADTTKRFLAAMRKGAHDYIGALAGPDGKRHDNADAPAIYQIISKYTKLSPEALKIAVGYVDPDLRLDTRDIARQLAWYHSQGFIKDAVTVDQVIDKRYVTALP